MDEGPVVCDTGPLIALSLVGHLELLSRLHERVIVPRAVLEEVTAGGLLRPGAEEISEASWLEVHDGIKPEPLLASELGAGEAAVIETAHQVEDWSVLLDDRRERRPTQHPDPGHPARRPEDDLDQHRSLGDLVGRYRQLDRPAAKGDRRPPRALVIDGMVLQAPSLASVDGDPRSRLGRGAQGRRPGRRRLVQRVCPGYPSGPAAGKQARGHEGDHRPGSRSARSRLHGLEDRPPVPTRSAWANMSPPTETSQRPACAASRTVSLLRSTERSSRKETLRESLVTLNSSLLEASMR